MNVQLRMAHKSLFAMSLLAVASGCGSKSSDDNNGGGRPDILSSVSNDMKPNEFEEARLKNRDMLSDSQRNFSGANNTAEFARSSNESYLCRVREFDVKFPSATCIDNMIAGGGSIVPCSVQVSKEGELVPNASTTMSSEDCGTGTVEGTGAQLRVCNVNFGDSSIAVPLDDADYCERKAAASVPPSSRNPGSKKPSAQPKSSVGASNPADNGQQFLQTLMSAASQNDCSAMFEAFDQSFQNAAATVENLYDTIGQAAQSNSGTSSNREVEGSSASPIVFENVAGTKHAFEFKMRSKDPKDQSGIQLSGAAYAGGTKASQVIYAGIEQAFEMDFSKMQSGTAQIAKGLLELASRNSGDRDTQTAAQSGKAKMLGKSDLVNKVVEMEQIVGMTITQGEQKLLVEGQSSIKISGGTNPSLKTASSAKVQFPQGAFSVSEDWNVRRLDQSTLNFEGSIGVSGTGRNAETGNPENINDGGKFNLVVKKSNGRCDVDVKEMPKGSSSSANKR